VRAFAGEPVGGNTIRELLAADVVPTAGSNEPRKGASVTYKRILVPVDGSATARLARLDEAARAGDLPGGAVKRQPHYFSPKP
jgi:hypothetical protein